MKRVRRSWLFALALVCLFGTNRLNAQNTLTKDEKKQGWKLLFDGKSTKGWHNYSKKTIGAAWTVTDGTLYLDTGIKDADDIVTDGEYENYDFTIDWKVEPCGNSGIIFNCVEAPEYKRAWETGPEMQILDNACHPDAKYEKHRAGNLYDLIASQQESVTPGGEWNTARIRCDSGQLDTWLNGVLQVSVKMFTPEWESLIQNSKFKSHPDFGKSKKGHIMLQGDHGKVWFRNIKILELKSKGTKTKKGKA